MKRYVDWRAETAELPTSSSEPLLHHLIYGDEKYDQMSLEVLSAFVDAQPEALYVKDPEHWGATPLHLQATYPSRLWADRILFLLDRCPDAAFIRSDFDEHLPVHLVFGAFGNTFLKDSAGKIRVLRRFLEVYPGSILIPRMDQSIRPASFGHIQSIVGGGKSETLWQIVCEEWNEYHRRRSSLSGLKASELLDGPIDDDILQKYESKWELLVFVLERSWSYLTTGRNNSELDVGDGAGVGISFRPLHAFLAEDFFCGGLVLNWFLSKYAPSHGNARDERGDLPLLILARNSNPPCRDDARERAVNRILDLVPDSASAPDRDGRLPLHLSLEGGVSWDGGAARILRLAPQALMTRDIKTRFYPFMLAAMAADGRYRRDSWDHSGLGTVYLLIRECPTLLNQVLLENDERLRENQRADWEVEREAVIVDNERLRAVVERMEVMTKHALSSGGRWLGRSRMR